MSPPPRNVPMDKVQTMIEQNVPIRVIAERLGVGVNTIKRRLNENNLKVRSKFNYDKFDLSNTVNQVLKKNCLVGLDSMVATLKSVGMTVPRRKVYESMTEIRGKSNIVTKKIVRRTYWVRSPLSMVHIDGNHSLIRWRFVILGGIDGYSRKIFFLGVSSDNKASSVLRFFLDGVRKYGLPSRIRCDKGKENIDAIRLMIKYRGAHRRSAIAGRSVHNTRIERLWVDMTKRCTHTMYSLFMKMEDDGILEPSSEIDIYCLHIIFVPIVQRELDAFARMWDLHKIRTAGYKSPNTLFKEGMHALAELAAEFKLTPTELDQGNTENIDPSILSDPIDDSYEMEEETIVVPPVFCPIEDQQMRSKIHTQLTAYYENQQIKIDNGIQEFIVLKEQLRTVCK